VEWIEGLQLKRPILSQRDAHLHAIALAVQKVLWVVSPRGIVHTATGALVVPLPFTFHIPGLHRCTPTTPA
jgi:hypothetical protein